MCDVYNTSLVVLIYILLFLQQISKHRFKFTKFNVAKCESRVSSTAIKHAHSKVATATTGCHWRRLLHVYTNN